MSCRSGKRSMQGEKVIWDHQTRPVSEQLDLYVFQVDFRRDDLYSTSTSPLLSSSRIDFPRTMSRKVLTNQIRNVEVSWLPVTSMPSRIISPNSLCPYQPGAKVIGKKEVLQLLFFRSLTLTPKYRVLISTPWGHAPTSDTEVQRISFVGYAGGEDGSPLLWNLQNLHAVPP